MLIYNFQKEFLGMDEKDLRFLGFKDLSALRNEVSDFADLFVKTPGYIHNFKHVHWIDFITCADSNEESKVIINVNNKNYKCFIQITTAYLVDNPSSKAYLVHLNKLKELSQQESEKISGDIAERVPSLGTNEVKPILNKPESIEEFSDDAALTVDPYETALDFSETEKEFAPDVIEDQYDSQQEIESDPEPLNISFEDDTLHIDESSVMEENSFEEETLPQEDYTEIDAPESIEVTLPDEEEQVESFDNGYSYDPSVASEELGLPLDLIEEFIQDFIEQAKEFKPKLYDALEEQDIDNLKILSHKLKGVAANLRIEDALETLTIINTSNDTLQIGENLDIFYKIIAKLAHEEHQETLSPKEDVSLDEPMELNLETEEEEEELKIDLDAPVELDTPVEMDLEEEVEEELKIDLDEPIELDTPVEVDLKEEEEEELKIDLDEPIELDLDTPVELSLEDEVEIKIDLDEPVELNFEEEEEEELKIDLDEPVELDLDTPVELSLEDEEEIKIDLDEPIEVSLEEETPISSLPTYSKEEVAKEIGLDIESFNELFNDYTNEATEIVTTLKGALENSDFEKVKSEVLKLKGMSNNMRVERLNSDLEILSESSDKESMLQALNSIEESLHELKQLGE